MTKNSQTTRRQGESSQNSPGKSVAMETPPKVMEVKSKKQDVRSKRLHHGKTNKSIKDLREISKKLRDPEKSSEPSLKGYTIKGAVYSKRDVTGRSSELKIFKTNSAVEDKRIDNLTLSGEVSVSNSNLARPNADLVVPVGVPTPLTMPDEDEKLVE